MKFNEFENTGNRNLWKLEGRYYRLFAHSVTPNGCWLAAPEMRELRDIDIATGKDIYGSVTIELDNGTVPGCLNFVTK